jgi:DNA-binding PadR family transcriptional regulator
MGRNRTPDSVIPLKPHWFYILLSLSGEPRHGYRIMQDVLERSDGKVRLWPPTLYGTIKRLIDEELIEPSEAAPKTEGDDSRRRYYRLTAFGRRVLKAECARLEDLVRAAHAARGLQAGKAV